MATQRPKPWGVVFLPYVEQLPYRGERFYGTHTQAKNAVQTKLDELAVWCSRYNKVGLEALDDVRREVNELQGEFDRHGGEGSPGERQISRCFDEHTGMSVRLKIRRMKLDQS